MGPCMMGSPSVWCGGVPFQWWWWWVVCCGVDGGPSVVVGGWLGGSNVMWWCWSELSLLANLTTVMLPPGEASGGRGKLSAAWCATY